MHYTASYARTHLSRLIRQAEVGEDVIIVRGTRPIARIVPLNGPKSDGQSDPDSAKEAGILTDRLVRHRRSNRLRSH
jgi:prevent-host-death family protein